MIFIDDIQRADPLTWAWIAELIASQDLRILVMLTVVLMKERYRRCDPSGTGALVTRGSATDVGDAQAAALHQRSGGNALFLTQLASNGEREAPPETIQSAVLDRCAEAGVAQRTLQSAAVLGASVDVDVLAAVLRADPIGLLEDLDVGVRLESSSDVTAHTAFATPSCVRCSMLRRLRRAVRCSTARQPGCCRRCRSRIHCWSPTMRDLAVRRRSRRWR